MSEPRTSGGGAQQYEVIDTLARGGMAEVFLGRQRVGDYFDRLVVMKATLPHLKEDDAFVRSFLDEARLAAQLQHPNIVQIFDVARLDGSPCIVMEWLRGRDLRHLLSRLSKQQQSVALDVAVAILIGAASALSHAHEATDARGQRLGIVHRDVTPHNIFLTRDGVVKLIDFGIAKSAQQLATTQAGVIKGKIGYLSPEHLRGEPIDARADLWSLGVVAWELFTGRRLFRAPSQMDAMDIVLERAIPSTRDYRPEVDEELDGIILSLLQRDIDLRTPNASHLLRQLNAWGRTHGVASAQELAAWLEEIVPSAEDPQFRVPSRTESLRLFSALDQEPTLLDANISDRMAFITEEEAPTRVGGKGSEAASKAVPEPVVQRWRAGGHTQTRAARRLPQPADASGDASGEVSSEQAPRETAEASGAATPTPSARTPYPAATPFPAPTPVVDREASSPAAAAEAPLEPRGGWRRVWLFGAGMLAGAVLGAVAAVWAPPPALWDAPEEYVVHLQNVPSGAKVILDGNEVPGSPVRVPADGEIHVIEVRSAEGTLISRQTVP